MATLAVHLGAVGVWVFAIAAACLAGAAAGRAGLVRVLAALSPWAVAAAGLVLVTGLSNAVLEAEPSR